MENSRMLCLSLLETTPLLSAHTLWLHRSPKTQNKMIFLKTNHDLCTLVTVVYSLLVGASVMELRIHSWILRLHKSKGVTVVLSSSSEVINDMCWDSWAGQSREPAATAGIFPSQIPYLVFNTPNSPALHVWYLHICIWVCTCMHVFLFWAKQSLWHF